MSRELIKKLNHLKHAEVKPREEWLKSNRELLMSQIKNTVPAEETRSMDSLWLGMSIFMPQKFVFNVVRPMAVLLVVALVGTSGWIATVDASYEALPGDWLYPAKRAVERTQVTAASIFGAKSTETKLHSEFAKRRAAEIKKVVLSDDPEREVKVAATVVDLKTEIQKVDTKLEEIKTSQERGQADVAQEIQKNTDQIKNDLKAAKDDLSASTSTGSHDLTQNISEAKDLAKDVNVKAVEVMVTKHLEGDTSITKEDVVKAIDDSIQSAVSDVAESRQNMENVQNLVSAVTTEVPVSAVTTTPDADKINAAVEQTKEATAKTQEAAVAIDLKATELKALVESGDLTKAVGVVKEVSETTKEVEKMQDSAISSVQQVVPAPVLAVVKEQASAAAVASSSIEAVKIIVTTTSASVEPGKLPVVVTVTTTVTAPAVTATSAAPAPAEPVKSPTVVSQ